MKLQAGMIIRHIGAICTDLEVMRIVEDGPDKIKLHGRLINRWYAIAYYFEEFVIAKSQLHKWSVVE